MGELFNASIPANMAETPWPLAVWSLSMSSRDIGRGKREGGIGGASRHASAASLKCPAATGSAAVLMDIYETTPKSGAPGRVGPVVATVGLGFLP